MTRHVAEPRSLEVFIRTINILVLCTVNIDIYLACQSRDFKNLNYESQFK